MKKIAIFASGTGSNFLAIHKAIHEKEVVVPDDLCFPFAVAREKALK